ncbi:MAG: orotidine 5'-phosphate decarboxylase / HUMPS family protein [Candidatus Levyibacteriota bacterium]
MTSHSPENPLPQDATSPMKERRSIIAADRSIIPACDLPDLESLARLVEATADVPGIGGYKVGIELGNPYGLIEVVKVVRERTNLPIIFDQQKGGNDIPQLGVKWVAGLKKAGVDSAILFPFSSPVTQREWTKALQDEEIKVMVGGHMTHEQFLESEGGYIADSAPRRIYQLGAEMGVQDFVVPGNKVELVVRYKQLLDELLEEGNYALHAPGFIDQGGDITETGRVAGKRFHPIVGGAIYNASDIRAKAQELTSKLLKAA